MGIATVCQDRRGDADAGVVLRYAAAARAAGLGVVPITHNPHHAYLVGDRFTLLERGRMAGSHPRSEITLEKLTTEMAGGSDPVELSDEPARTDPKERPSQ